MRGGSLVADAAQLLPHPLLGAANAVGGAIATVAGIPALEENEDHRTPSPIPRDVAPTTWKAMQEAAEGADLSPLLDDGEGKRRCVRPGAVDMTYRARARLVWEERQRAKQDAKTTNDNDKTRSPSPAPSPGEDAPTEAAGSPPPGEGREAQCRHQRINRRTVRWVPPPSTEGPPPDRF